MEIRNFETNGAPYHPGPVDQIGHSRSIDRPHGKWSSSCLGSTDSNVGKPKWPFSEMSPCCPVFRVREADEKQNNEGCPPAFELGPVKLGKFAIGLSFALGVVCRQSLLWHERQISWKQIAFNKRIYTRIQTETHRHTHT